MTEENRNIFLPGGDALVYLAGTTHEKCYTTIVWYHSFSTCVSYDRFSTPFPLVRYVRIYINLPFVCVISSF